MTPGPQALHDRRWHVALILFVVLPLYVLNARWGPEGNLDALSAALPAYQVAEHGNLDLSEYQAVAGHPERLERWFVETPDGQIVSNRAPGLIALAIPAYIASDQTRFSSGPATVVALVATILAVLITWQTLSTVVGLNAATFATLTLALGTTTWWVSSSELWPHGPGQLWAAVAVLSLSGGSYLGTGGAFALSITTRPLTALFPLLTGLLETKRNSSFKPAVVVGTVSALGLAGVVLYNRGIFERWTLRGGYSSDFTTGALERFGIFDYLENVWEMFLGWPNGVLTTSPILGISLIGATLIWREIPGWAKSVALAGFGYLMVHALLNRASGGAVIFYRYPLEAIVLAAPVFTLGALHLWERGGRWRLIVGGAIAASVALQVVHVFVMSCWITDPVVNTCLLR